MEDIEDLKIIISSLRDVFVEYLRPDVLDILASKSEMLNLSLKSQIEKYQEESKEQQKGLSKLLDDILEDDNFLLDFIQILHQDSYNSGESLFIASQLEDGKDVQIGKSISLFLLLMNNDCVLQLTCQDIYDIIQKLVAYNFIRKHDYEQLQCKKYKPLHLFLEMFRSIKHYEPKWFPTFICLLKEKKPNVFDLNSNAKGWKKTASSSVDMLEDLKNITAIHKDVNIPDNESVVSSLSSLSTSSESCSIYSDESESNLTGILTPSFVLQEKNLFSKVVHPDIWKDLDSLGILDFTQIICDDFSEGCTDLERDSDCSLSQTEENGVLAFKDYQLELTEHAVKGKNTIIYAPTGSGKTIVAIYIILKHLERRRNKKPVAFFATTIPLVKQQCSRITKYLKDKYKVLQVTSENDYSMSLNMILSGYDVVVMTPKILENHFRKSYLNISDFSLLVFDECHHTHKKEPYLNLMSFYLKAKKQSSAEESKVNLPQIIGLTASISIGNTKKFEEAVKNILKVCANLDAEKVSTVVKYEAQLKADVNEPEEELHLLSDTSNIEIVKELKKQMSKLEERLDYNSKAIECLQTLVCSRPKDQLSPQYGQWAMNVFTRTRLIKPSDPLHTKYVTNIMTIADYLLAYSIAVEMLILVHIKDVLQFLANYLGKYRKTKDSATEEIIYHESFLNIKQLLEHKEDSESRNLNVLKEKLMENLVVKDSTSCGIVFVRTRAMTESLTSWINQCEDLSPLRARAFTGTTSMFNHRGLSQSEQEEIIQLFGSGQVRLLVATSVCDEGLDIPACSLVIIYNHVGNEVTSLQRKGRARQKGGKCILLATEASYIKEKVNLEKRKLMLQAIRYISKMTPQKVTKSNTSQHDKILKDTDKISFDMGTGMSKEIPFKMVCSYCKSLVIESKNVKVFLQSHRVAVDSNILKQIKVFPLQSALNGKNSQSIGAVYCNSRNCINKLGTMMVLARAPFVVLKAENLVFDSEEHVQQTDTGRFSLKYCHFRQWNKVPYKLEDLETKDILSYLSQLSQAIHKDTAECST
ncbi:ATP-dependent RNA helicase DDX58 isoform X1 [Biomphalaria glabrata]|nr:putative ATP-dependent RNA helicase DDX58 isoform X1 [Biomphalaria glabrata]